MREEGIIQEAVVEGKPGKTGSWVRGSHRRANKSRNHVGENTEETYLPQKLWIIEGAYLLSNALMCLKV